MFGEEPRAILTVFRSRLRPDAEAVGYHDVADEMESRARAMPGFLEFKTFTAADGERISLAMFDSLDNHNRWRDDPAHRDVQRRGRAEFYTEYRIAVTQVLRETTFTADGHES
jgi:heme-degrading monooxygenase HmoA